MSAYELAQAAWGEQLAIAEKMFERDSVVGRDAIEVKEAIDSARQNYKKYAELAKEENNESDLNIE